MKREIAAVALGVTLVCSAQSVQEPLFRISTFMTPHEMEITGVAKLSPAQRAALDQWLTRYSMTILRYGSGGAGQQRATGTYVPGKGHWIDSVSSNGAIVTLEDGSMWDISTLDQIDTALWLPITDITVMVNPRPIGDYKFILVNTDDGEKATARYLGTH